MEQGNNEKKSTIVKTYTEDVISVLESDQGGLVKKVIHSEEKHEAERRNLSPESTRNRIFMFVSLFLVLISLMALFFFFLPKKLPEVQVQEQFTPLIFNDKVSLADVSGLKKDYVPERILGKADVAKLKRGGINGIYLTFDKAPVGLRKFIEIIEGSFVLPGAELVSDNFLLGVVKNSNTSVNSQIILSDKDFFVLLKMRSVTDIFDAMRAWEKKMFIDLHKFFGVEISPETKYLLTKNFEDGIIENKNARILYDEQGSIVMMYVFADNNSIIVTKERSVVKEIMLRLASSEIKK